MRLNGQANSRGKSLDSGFVLSFIVLPSGFSWPLVEKALVFGGALFLALGLGGLLVRLFRACLGESEEAA